MTLGPAYQTGSSTDPTITTGSEGDLVQIDASGKLVPAGARVDPVTGVTTYDSAIEVPAGSVQIGEVLQLSEGTADLVTVNLLKETMSFSPFVDFDDDTGSSPPTFINFGSEAELILQGTDTTIITTNPLDFFFIGAVVAPDIRLFDQVTMKANGPMTNTAVRLVDNATGVVIRYIPSKAAWEGRKAGIDMIAGDNTFFFTSNATDTPGNFHLGFTPLLIEENQQINFTFKGDTVDLLGNATDIPFIRTEIHDGTPTELLSIVTTDATLTGDGTVGDPLSVAGGVTSKLYAAEIDGTATTSLTLNDWVQVNISPTVVESDDFTHDGSGVFTYIGLTDKTFDLLAGLSQMGVGNDKRCEFAWFLNNITEMLGRVNMDMSTSKYYGSVVPAAVVTLSTNDNVRVFMRNTEDSSNTAIESSWFKIKEW